jgi:hypothetical protein
MTRTQSMKNLAKIDLNIVNYQQQMKNDGIQQNKIKHDKVKIQENI